MTDNALNIRIAFSVISIHIPRVGDDMITCL